MVSVTVNARGEVTELKFHTTRYRAMAPAELASALMDVLQDAREEMNETIRQVVEPMMPNGPVDFRGLFAGDSDWAELADSVFNDLRKGFPGRREH